MTNTEATPVTARDRIRAHLRTAVRPPTRAELVAAMAGTVATTTIENFIHDARKSGEIVVERTDDGRRELKLRSSFVDPRRALRATLLETRNAIVALMRRESRPMSIDVILAALADGVDHENVVRALVKSMAKAKILLSSLHDGTPCYQLSNTYRAIPEQNSYQPPREVRRAEPVSPPAPKERVASQAPTGPAPVATESPASSPPPSADVPSAIAAASETTLDDVAVVDDGQRFPSVPPSIAEQARWLAEDITTAAKEATADSTDSNTLRLMIDCVANANRLAGLTARGGA